MNFRETLRRVSRRASQLVACHTAAAGASSQGFTKQIQASENISRPLTNSFDMNYFQKILIQPRKNSKCRKYVADDSEEVSDHFLSFWLENLPLLQHICSLLERKKLLLDRHEQNKL